MQTMLPSKSMQASGHATSHTPLVASKTRDERERAQSPTPSVSSAGRLTDRSQPFNQSATRGSSDASIETSALQDAPLKLLQQEPSLPPLQDVHKANYSMDVTFILIIGSAPSIAILLVLAATWCASHGPGTSARAKGYRKTERNELKPQSPWDYLVMDAAISSPSQEAILARCNQADALSHGPHGLRPLAASPWTPARVPPLFSSHIAETP